MSNDSFVLHRAFFSAATFLSYYFDDDGRYVFPCTCGFKSHTRRGRNQHIAYRQRRQKEED